MSHPTERGKYIQAIERQLSDILDEAEGRRLRKEEKADFFGSPRTWQLAAVVSGLATIAFVVSQLLAA